MSNSIRDTNFLNMARTESSHASDLEGAEAFTSPSNYNGTNSRTMSLRSAYNKMSKYLSHSSSNDSTGKPNNYLKCCLCYDKAVSLILSISTSQRNILFSYYFTRKQNIQQAL